MQINNRNQLKGYFQANKRPKESEFGDLIDSVALVSEIPQPELKVYKVVSFLLTCNGSTSRPKIGYTILENTLTDLSIHIALNRIVISSTDNFYEFDLNRIFINTGVLNDTCEFDKVVFSLSESTNKELVLYCETIEIAIEEPEVPSIPDGPGIPGGPGNELPGSAISFQQLPIEIRIYNE